eukprot:365868-Chlamydomonas_euryale.AAC.6
MCGRGWHLTRGRSVLLSSASRAGLLTGIVCFPIAQNTLLSLVHHEICKISRQKAMPVLIIREIAFRTQQP